MVIHCCKYTKQKLKYKLKMYTYYKSNLNVVNEADLSPSSSTKIKNVWHCIAFHP
jgi:hypothetical protein